MHYRFLLIRANTKKKRENLYLLHVRLSEASRIAYWSRTANLQKPTLVYATIPDTTAFAVDYIRDIYYISTGIYCCLALVSNQNFARIADNQETMRRVNAFYYVYAAPPRVIPDRASAVRSAPANLAIFPDLKKMRQKVFFAAWHVVRLLRGTRKKCKFAV